MTIEWVEIEKLKPNPKNPNRHSEAQIKRLADIIKYQGWRHPIITDSNYLIWAGHGRLEAAKLLKIQKVPVHIQEFLSEEQAYAFLVSDNAIASWAELDLANINMELPALGPDFDIDMLGIEDFVLEPADKGGLTDEDSVPEVASNKSSRCILGDLWILGSHRLLCGDSTSSENVARLMNGEKADMVFTDPPYGIGIDPKRYDNSNPNGWKSYEKNKINSLNKIEGDAAPFDFSLVSQALTTPKESFIFGANNFLHLVPDYQKGSWFCWDRTGGSEGLLNMLGSSFELCWSKQRHKYQIVRLTWKGANGHNKKDDGDNKKHPSQKPVKLAEWFFNEYGEVGEKILDLFLGSGSTLIACEKTNRKCYGMEIDPHYCDVIIERWQKYTGKEAIREDGIKWVDLKDQST